jgi:hypothetical protein
LRASPRILSSKAVARIIRTSWIIRRSSWHRSHLMLATTSLPWPCMRIWRIWTRASSTTPFLVSHHQTSSIWVRQRTLSLR